MNNFQHLEEKLVEACESDDLYIVQNYRGNELYRNPYEYYEIACRNGSQNIAMFLVSSGLIAPNQGLIEACDNDMLHLTSLLFSMGASPLIITPVIFYSLPPDVQTLINREIYNRYGFLYCSLFARPSAVRAPSSSGRSKSKMGFARRL